MYSSKPFHLKSLLISHPNAIFSPLGNYKHIYHSIKVIFHLFVRILGKGKRIKINFSNYIRRVKWICWKIIMIKCFQFLRKYIDVLSNKLYFLLLLLFVLHRHFSLIDSGALISHQYDLPSVRRSIL